MTKTFNIAGYTKLSGQYKARFANGTVAERTRVLKRDNHADIHLVELPKAMSKSEAAQFVLDSLTTVEPAVVEVAVAARTPLTAKSVTFVFRVVAVAVTVLFVAAPVEYAPFPKAKVPENLPKLAATGLASVRAADVVPEATLEKAAATSLAVMFTRAVKVRPLTVTKSLGLSALNVMTFDSVVAAAAPWATFAIVTKLALVPVAAKSATAVFVEVDVNLTTELGSV